MVETPVYEASTPLLSTFLGTAAGKARDSLKEQRLAAGDTWEQNPTQQYVHFVCAGVISHRVSSADGTSVSVHLSGAGDLVELPEMVASLSAPARAVALFPTHVLRVPSRLLQQALHENANFRAACMRSLSLRYFRSSQVAICSAVHDIQSRVARHLYTLTRHSEVLPVLTQETLALELAAQRTSVCLAMNELRAKGVLEFSRGKITILCRGKLAAFACECKDIVG